MKLRATLLLALILAPSLAAEPFATVTVDARSAALGGVRAGMGIDPGAGLSNPALLAELSQPGAQFLYRDWYGSGAQSMAAGWAMPWRGGGMSLSWHRFGLGELYTEDCLALGLGLHVAPRILAGIQIKGLQLAVPGYEGSDYAGDARSLALDLSLQYTLRDNLQFNWLEENLYAGEMELLDGGETWPAAPRGSRQSLRYLWRQDLALVLEHWGRPGRDATLLFGAELRFFDAFHVRAGSGLNSVTVGFGLKARRWRADFAFESRGRLGNCLTFAFAPLLGEGGQR